MQHARFGAPAPKELARLASAAFGTGGERAWRNLHGALRRLVASGSGEASPALARLSAFLAENADLAEPAHR